VTAAWATLGLQQTDDVAEIKRAYARRLKTTDVDDDPASFVALREALEAALNYAAFGFDPNEPVTADGLPPVSFEIGAAECDEDEDGTTSVDRASPAETIAIDAAANRFSTLEAMLFGDPDRWPDPDMLEEAVQAVLDHPDMEKVDHGPNAEFWLAELLLDAAPRSDSVIPMVVEHFRWNERDSQWDHPWQIDALVSRYLALCLIEHLQNPRHVHHDAWLELTSPDPELGWNRFFVKGKVRRLLDVIRERAPAAEEMLAPHRVALFDAGRDYGQVSAPTVIQRIVFAVWILYLLGKVASCAQGNP